ncbi:unnamed protein product [Umbelopsis vinacea]
MFKSTPKITYFALPNHIGRAEPILLCLQDAGVKYELDLIPLDWSTWPSCKADLIAKGYPSGTLPVMELEGRQYSQVHPILRYICGRLSQYLGGDIEEEYKVNEAADICSDWYTARITAAVTSQDARERHIQTKRHHFLAAAEALLSQTSGPYLLGDKITYADFLLFSNARDEYTAAKLVEYPHIHSLGNALAKRTNVRQYRPELMG